MHLERRLEGREQLLKLVERQTRHIQALRGAGLQIGKPYTGHSGCLLSMEAQYIINRDKLTYIRAIRETLRDPVHTGKGGRPRLRPWHNVLIAQVVKRYERRRVVETERRIVAGTPARVETLRRRSQGNGVINTAYIERLNATFRERLASLTRRGRALARCTPTLQHGMCLIGTVYNFCTPHASLGLVASGAGRRCVQKTPAMAAGITDHCWSMRELLAYHVPPSRWTPPTQRGRPSHAVKRLIER